MFSSTSLPWRPHKFTSPRTLAYMSFSSFDNSRHWLAFRNQPPATVLLGISPPLWNTCYFYRVRAAYVEARWTKVGPSVREADFAGIYFLPLIITELSPYLSQQLSPAYLWVGLGWRHKSNPPTPIQPGCYFWRSGALNAARTLFKQAFVSGLCETIRAVLIRK